MRSARHALSAAALAAVALGCLTACNELDLTAFQTAAHSTGTSAAEPAQRASALTTDAAGSATSGSTASSGAAAAARSTTATSTGATPTGATSTTTAARARRTTATPAAPTSARKPTTSKPTATTTPADGSVAGQILGLVNAERSKTGCKPVTLDSRLTAAAAGHAQDMAANDYFSHTSQDGRSFVDRIKEKGYPAPRSENIAAGQPTVAAVMAAWMASSGHRANILDCSATQMGAGSAKGGTFGVYWVQDFGRG